MENSLKYIAEKYKLNLKQRQQPIEIPNTTRTSLAELFFELGFTKGAEIGVEQGLYSEVLLHRNPNLHLTSIDAWQAYKGYRDHTTQDRLDSFLAITKERLKTWTDQGRCDIVKGFSVEVAKNIPDESLDFVYIDANHEFVHVVNDIAVWERKVKVGGIVSGHDYIKRKTNGYLMHVPMAIHGWIESYQIKPLFVLGRKEKRTGEQRETTRSWFYVKQESSPVKQGWDGWEKTIDTK